MVFDMMDHASLAAIVSEEGFISHKELMMAADSIANAVGGRCLLFLFCENEPAAIAGYVGFINHRIVPVMMDSDMDDALLDGLNKLYRPAYFWLPKEKVEKYPEYNPSFEWQGYVLLATGESGQYGLDDELALLMTTSGSTGSPKLVKQSYKNLRANTESIVEYLKIDSTERAITNLPMNYVYGLSLINSHLYAGASIAVTKKTLFDKAFWSFFREKQVTNLAGVPYTYEMLAKLRFFRMELPSLRYMTQAGGKLSPELHKRFAEYAVENGKRFVVMYGAAEATARMGYLPAELSLEKYGSMGIAIPGGRFELLDDDGNTITDIDTVGELIYYGDNVTMGYAVCGEDLGKPDEWGGRLATGDLAKRDKDGIYTVVGRKKRFLKIFGKRTNLQEVENLLKQEFDGVEFACGGVDDKLFVFTTTDGIESSVIEYINNKTGLHRSAFKVVVLAEIPKNKSGKIVYKDLEKYYV